MPLLSTTFKRIIDDHKAYAFMLGDDFIWSAARSQITYRHPRNFADIATLLHEIAHALLGHADYDLDIELIAYEVAAWKYAQETLATRYGFTIDQNHIEDHLDTYRLWLHERSQCPACNQNGLQTTKNTYSCNNCRCIWRVNEARMCRLKRTKLPVQDRSF